MPFDFTSRPSWSAPVEAATPAAERLSSLSEVERAHILRVLDACRGVRSDAARTLGIDRKTLYRRLRLYGV